jgi:hypothetical protein
LIDTNGNNVTYASALSSSNTGGLTLADSNGGTGSLTLAPAATAASTYSGPTTVTGGTLIGAANSFGTGNVTVNPVTGAATLSTNGSIAPTADVTVNTTNYVGTLQFQDYTPTIAQLATYSAPAASLSPAEHSRLPAKAPTSAAPPSPPARSW